MGRGGSAIESVVIQGLGIEIRDLGNVLVLVLGEREGRVTGMYGVGWLAVRQGLILSEGAREGGRGWMNGWMNG